MPARLLQRGDGYGYQLQKFTKGTAKQEARAGALARATLSLTGLNAGVGRADCCARDRMWSFNRLRGVAAIQRILQREFNQARTHSKHLVPQPKASYPQLRAVRDGVIDSLLAA